jgi:pimeloyl-ACP methyl ester carboxylesterase
MDMVRRINVHRLCHRMQLTQANGTVRKRGYGTSYRSKKKDYVMREFISDVRAVIEALQKDKPVESRRVTLVAHDWGAIVAWHVLADSWKLEKSDQGYIDKGVIINIGHPMVSLANIVQPFKEYFKVHWLLQLITKPKSTSVTLHKAFAPVFTQLMKSYYIYIFQLPTPFGRSFAKVRDWYFQELIVKGIKTSTPDDVEMYKAAAAYGPPEDPTPGFDHAVQYYRHGAAVEGWSLSKPEDGYIGYPVLVLWVSLTMVYEYF